jgi:hypothetical protein
MILVTLGSGLVELLIGWIAGMWTRKRSDLWCPLDGSQLTCAPCMTAGAHSLGGPGNLLSRLSATFRWWLRVQMRWRPTCGKPRPALTAMLSSGTGPHRSAGVLRENRALCPGLG